MFLYGWGVLSLPALATDVHLGFWLYGLSGGCSGSRVSGVGVWAWGMEFRFYGLGVPRLGA